MDKQKHTPGPWESETLKEQGLIKISGRDQVLVHAHVICYSENGIPSEEEQANGQLIAAAPELLAALRRAEVLAQIAVDWDLGSDGKVEIDGEWIDCGDLRDEFRAAISKAEGSAE